MKLSIIIVSTGRLEALKECCRTVALALPPESEVLVIVRGKSPATCDWLESFKHPAFRGFEISASDRATLRNGALSRSEGEIVYFIDEEVRVPQHLFLQTLRDFDSDPELTLTGGPLLADSQSTPPTKLMTAVLTSWFAAPHVRRRYGAGLSSTREASQQDFVGSNFAIRKSKIPPGVTFNENLESNEESLFIYECQKKHSLIRYSPTLFVVSGQTPTWSDFSKQIQSYGVGRGQQTWQNPASFSLAYALPASTLFVLLTILAAAFTTGSWWLPPALLLAYVALALAGYSQSSQLKGLGFYGLLSIPLTAVIHVSYSLGFWRGVLRSAFNLPGLAVPALETRR
jgi:hypothetical protein